MKKLFLHIGPPKTGSTTIQDLLHRVSGQLLEQGILYPNAMRIWSGDPLVLNRGNDRTLVCSPLNSHLVLGYALRGQIEDVNADDCWAKLLEELSRSSTGTIILSAEIFGNLEHEHISRIKDYLAGFDIRIIAYVREPFARALSQYTQRVKTGRGFESFRIYVSERINHLEAQYADLFASWVQSFGADRLVVKHFDDISSKISGLELDFLHTIGAITSTLEYTWENQSKNPSPRPEFVRLLRAVNAVECLAGRSELMRPLFKRLRHRLFKSANATPECTSAVQMLADWLLSFLKGPIYREQERRLIHERVGQLYQRQTEECSKLGPDTAD